MVKLYSGDSTHEAQYINFPDPYPLWEYKFAAGLGITKLPTQIVEEEINTSPIVYGSFRISLPLNFSGSVYFATNYISNIGTLGLDFAPITSPIVLSIGARSSIWFGHVEMESIRLKSYGLIFKPLVSAGINFGDLLFTGSFEVQYSTMKTYSEDALLATFKQPNSGYILRFTLEQPLYNNHWVLLGLGLNYSNFYYQSWISYSAIKSYLLYPEIYFGFII